MSAVWRSLLWVTIACDGAGWPPTEPCTSLTSTREVSVSGKDLIDVLFVIDVGPSMAEEQALLARELPRMLGSLLQSDGPRSLHFGVLTSDMGVGASQAVAGCSALGEDGVLRRSPEAADAAAFVWHFSGYHDPASTLDSVTQQARARPGAQACEVAQPLEAVLQALLPLDAALKPELADVQLRAGSTGHGARENSGFLRYNPIEAPALLLIVIITDGDDCSLASPWPEGAAPDTGCASDATLHAVQRYSMAFKELSGERLVRVAIIAGLPQDLELSSADAAATLGTRDSRDAYYERVLHDPRMQGGLDAAGAARSSCESSDAKAAPPRRLVELARQFGETARVSSICGDDFAAVLEDLVNLDRRSPEPACGYDHVLEDGAAECRVSWELRAVPDPEEPLTPSRCSDRPDFLSEPGPDAFPFAMPTGVVCDVRRASIVRDAQGAMVVEGDGYYLRRNSPSCPNPSAFTIAFTDGARPPTGVRVRASCSDTLCAVSSP